MRKTIFTVLTICALSGILQGCSNLLDNPQSSAETGTVQVQVGTASIEARTVGPSVEAFVEYKLIFDNGPVVIPEFMTPSENGKAFDLKPGSWTLSVTGFIDVDGEKRPAVSGRATISVAAGKTIQAKVILAESEADTYGTFDYSAIDLSRIEGETLKTAAMTITPSDPNQGTVEIDLLNENNGGTLELPPGLYTILVELTSGRLVVINSFEHELNAYREEIVYIYPYMTTALRMGEYEFTETDFIADLYFTGTAVIDPDSTGADTYKPTKVHILKAVDNDGYKIDDNLGFDYRLITEAPIDDNGNWELYLPSNLIADAVEAPFTSADGEYQSLSGYPVFFSFTMQSQQNPANTMQSRWIQQEIVNKHGIRDIALEAKIRKITVPSWGTVEGNSAVKTGAGYDVVYADDLDNKIILTVNTANNRIISNSVEVKKIGGDDLTAEDELDVVPTQHSVYITFKMPDVDVTVSAKFIMAIPDGIVIVHAADNSNGGYTAQQVFVWLEGDGNPGGGSPVFIDTGTVTGNTWRFDLPSDKQAYSGNFLFQFRLTKADKPDILSKQFEVDVLELANDVGNKISLPIEIRTLTVADTAGKGTVTITASEMRDANGLITPPSITASGDHAAVDTDLRVTVTPTEGNYPSGLRYAQTGSSNSDPAELISSGGGSSKTYKFTMQPYNTTVTAEFVETSTSIGNIEYSSVSDDIWTLQEDERWKSPTISANGVTKARVSFTSNIQDVSITIQLDVSSESGCDYAFISELDNENATYQSGYYSGSVISGENTAAITIPVLFAGEHFIDIGYRKDGSIDNGSDCAWFKVIQ